MRFISSTKSTLVGLTISAKVAGSSSDSSPRNLMSVAPHPRMLIEAVSSIAPVSLTEFIGSKSAKDPKFCAAPISEKSAFVPDYTETLVADGQFMEMFLDTLGSEIRLNILEKTMDIESAWIESVGAELERIRVVNEMEAERFRNLMMSQSEFLPKAIIGEMVEAGKAESSDEESATVLDSVLEEHGGQNVDGNQPGVSVTGVGKQQDEEKEILRIHTDRVTRLATGRDPDLSDSLTHVNPVFHINESGKVKNSPNDMDLATIGKSGRSYIQSQKGWSDMAVHSLKSMKASLGMNRWISHTFRQFGEAMFKSKKNITRDDAEEPKWTTKWAPEIEELVAGLNLPKLSSNTLRNWDFDNKFFLSPFKRMRGILSDPGQKAATVAAKIIENHTTSRDDSADVLVTSSDEGSSNEGATERGSATPQSSRQDEFKASTQPSRIETYLSIIRQIEDQAGTHGQVVGLLTRRFLSTLFRDHVSPSGAGSDDSSSNPQKQLESQLSSIQTLDSLRFSKKMAFMTNEISIISSLRKGAEDSLRVMKNLRSVLHKQMMDMIGQATSKWREVGQNLDTLDDVIYPVYYDAEAFTSDMKSEEAPVSSDAVAPRTLKGFLEILKHLEDANNAETDHKSQPQRTKYTLMVMKELHSHIIALYWGLDPERAPIKTEEWTTQPRSQRLNMIMTDILIPGAIDALMRRSDQRVPPQDSLKTKDSRNRVQTTPEEVLDSSKITSQCILYGEIDGSQIFAAPQPSSMTNICEKPNSFGKFIIKYRTDNIGLMRAAQTQKGARQAEVVQASA